MVDRWYTPLPEALSRLAGAADFGPPPPDGLPPRGYAIFARQLASPSHEVRRFLRLALNAGLTPVFFEFHADKFVTCNADKLALVRMRFSSSLAHHSAPSWHDLADLQQIQGRAFSDIRVWSGELLPTFHRRLLLEQVPDARHTHLFDASSWFRSLGSSAAAYYRSFLSLFVSRGVLFESYHPTARELPFLRDIVAPAIADVVERFGQPPLIVNLETPKCVHRAFWQTYPARLRNCLPMAPQRSGHALSVILP